MAQQAEGAAPALEAATIALEAAPPPQAEVMLPEQAEAATVGVSRLTGGTLHLFLQSSSVPPVPGYSSLTHPAARPPPQAAMAQQAEGAATTHDAAAIAPEAEAPPLVCAA